MIIPPDSLILNMSRARRDPRPSLRLPLLPIDTLRLRVGLALIVAGRAIAGERRSAPASRASAPTA